jgi:hypothetical protein
MNNISTETETENEKISILQILSNCLVEQKKIEADKEFLKWCRNIGPSQTKFKLSICDIDIFFNFGFSLS